MGGFYGKDGRAGCCVAQGVLARRKGGAARFTSDRADMTAADVTVANVILVASKDG